MSFEFGNKLSNIIKNSLKNYHNFKQTGSDTQVIRFKYS
jgi:hypothetical protein